MDHPSYLAGVGRLLAFAGMIALASAVFAVVLQASDLLFYGIKILGAAYLFYLAFQLWRASPMMINMIFSDGLLSAKSGLS